MKFNTYDELLNYLKDKPLPSLEFTIDEVESELPVDGECDGECSADPMTPAVSDEPTEIVTVEIDSFYDKPVMEFASGTRNIMIVDSFTHIPNSCSTTSLTVLGRSVTTCICENDAGIPVAKFDIIIDGKYTQREFELYTCEATGVKNTIIINE